MHEPPFPTGRILPLIHNPSQSKTTLSHTKVYVENSLSKLPYRLMNKMKQTIRVTRLSVICGRTLLHEIRAYRITVLLINCASRCISHLVILNYSLRSLLTKQGLFTQTPYVFLTAEHSVLGQKHDAATLWVENVNSQGFDACLREMQNFDGLHENITVVRCMQRHKVDILFLISDLMKQNK